MTEVLSRLSDVPCRCCNYNLRGLEQAGRCPECGTDIADSVAFFQAQLEARQWRTRWWELADKKRLASVAEGAAIGLLGLIVKASGAWLPAYCYAWKTAPRVIPLALLSIAWVLELVACWKLGAADRIIQVKPRWLFPRSSVRVLIVVFLTAVAAVWLWDSLPEAVGMPIALCAVFAGLMAGALAFWRLRETASQISVTCGVLALFLSFMAPLWFIIALTPGLDPRADSLHGIAAMPSSLSGSAQVLFNVRQDHEFALSWVGMLLPVMVFAFELQLLLGLRRIIRQRRASETP